VSERPTRATPEPAQRLRVYLGERDHQGGQPLYTAIVHAARTAGIAGATVLKGIEGYGGHSIVHAARIVDLAADLPIVVELIDSPAAIAAFLPVVTGMLGGGLVTLEDLTIVYRSNGKQPA
jgi:PII-like signaling protein